MKSALIYVQHLLGTGHLRRMEILADAMAKRGIAVTLVSGGIDPPNCTEGSVKVVQLPAVKSDAAFSGLFCPDGSAANESYLTERKKLLLDVFASQQFNALIIEMYPFGRRQMRFEILPLLEASRSAKISGATLLVCSSIREILQGGKSEKRNLEICDLLERYFDHVLVHGDPSRITLEQSFPLASRISDMTNYTGYVTAPWAPSSVPERQKNRVLVSSGGGAAGFPVYELCLRAAREPRGKSMLWHVLVGKNLDDPRAAKLFADIPDNVTVEPNRNDFRQLLARSGVSVSQAGYNTVMDLVCTRTPSVLIPFEGVSETEQLTRARHFSEGQKFLCLRENGSRPDTLLNAIESLQAAPRSESLAIVDLRGAEFTADWLVRHC